MTRRLIVSPRRAPLALVFAGLIAAASITGGRAVLADRTSTEELGGNARALCALSTDKPIYRPGERVYVRGVLLDAFTRRPVVEAAAQPVGSFEVMGPKGDIVAATSMQYQDSILGCAWRIPDELAGGQYTLRVKHPMTGEAPAERKIDIRAFRAPRLRSQIEFLRDGYGPGDRITATLSVRRAEGGIPVGAIVNAIARVDGVEVGRDLAMVDRNGGCTVHIELPQQIERGEGSLAMVIEDGGLVETATKTIPILLSTVDLALYPEGGDLVAGLESRVYFEARLPTGKPADIAGDVVDSRGVKVASFASEHEGRGLFAFTPRAGDSYSLKLREPASVTRSFELPAIAAEGATLSTEAPRFAPGEAVRISAATTTPGDYRITLSQRERDVAEISFELGAGAPREVALTPPSTASGVLVATLWNGAGKPLAERLVYREPRNSVRIEIEADRENYVPGDRVSLKIRTTDGRGLPIGATVGVAISDDSVLEMVETREQAPALPAMVLLEGEVREFADAGVYLDPANPQAPRALDLLLGTQGWRRFAFQDAASFLAEHGDEARRVLAVKVSSAHEVWDLLDRDAAKAGEEARNGLRVRFARADAPPPEAPADAAEGAEPVGAPVAAAARPAAERDDRKQLPAGQAVGRLEAEALMRQRERVAGAGSEAMQEALGLAAEKDEIGLLDMEAESRARRAMSLVRGDVVAIREYAHQARAGRRPGQRSDFTETLYFGADIRTDATTGEARISFDLSDSVTSFNVRADAFTATGALGATTTEIESVEPFYTEIKLPLEVTSGDRLLLPVVLASSVQATLEQAGFTVQVGEQSLPGAQGLLLDGGARHRHLVEFIIQRPAGVETIVVDSHAGGYTDRVTRTLKVAPRGFPGAIARGGILEPDSSVSFEIEIPENMVAGSARSAIDVYPTPLANLTSALERLLREPHGCFEQTSSTNYPLVMAQQYFDTHSGVDASLVARGRELIAKGYDRLVSFECKDQGYEWFGQSPGHEALTAFGLLEFSDMSLVSQVDDDMMQRTRQWLLATRDGKGGFRRERRALHTWIEDRDCSDAYITWALLESGERALEKEIGAIARTAATSDNSYVIALGANVLALAGDQEGAVRLMERLVERQQSDGKIDGATASIVGSGGDALVIEATSLAALAWLREPRFAAAAEQAIRYLATACEQGRYGSTQSTVLALRAIVAYDRSRARPMAPGTISLEIDGHSTGGALAFDGETEGAITLGDIAEMLTPGKHEVTLTMKGGSSMPYSVAVEYSSLAPLSSPECKLKIETSLTEDVVEEGEITNMTVKVGSLVDEAIPTPVAIVGIPGGLEVRHDQLKETVDAGKIAAYEILGRELVLYWRSFEARAEVDLLIDLVAEIPGTTTAPASRTYLYYTDEHKVWVKPLRVTITP